jgi:Ca2+-binding RTX toxin-like protein
MRFTSLSVVALLGASLLVPMGTASAAGETCQGQPATIVGAPDQTIIGTEGADVVVTNGATKVDTFGGDDVICVTGQSGTVTIDAGAGSDSVLVEVGAGPTHTVLGDGADSFVAQNDQQHSVNAGPLGGPDTDVDIIRIPNAFSRVASGALGTPNADILELGGAILTWRGVQVAPGAVSGAVELNVASNSDQVTVDVGNGTMTSADSSLSFSGVGSVHFSTTVERGKLTFRGGATNNFLTLDAPMTYDHDIDMGGGTNYYETNSLGGQNSSVKGGGNGDRLSLVLPTYKVRAEMNHSRISATHSGVKTTTRIRGFRDLSLSAKQATVVGTNRGESINLLACKAFVRAKGGNDVITVDGGRNEDWVPPFGDWIEPLCSNYSAKVFGGRGDDKILGSPGNDRLIGGPGKDRVEGRGGRDVCQGEKVRTCKKRN